MRVPPDVSRTCQDQKICTRQQLMKHPFEIWAVVDVLAAQIQRSYSPVIVVLTVLKVPQCLESDSVSR